MSFKKFLSHLLFGQLQLEIHQQVTMSFINISETILPRIYTALERYVEKASASMVGFRDVAQARF